MPIFVDNDDYEMFEMANRIYISPEEWVSIFVGVTPADAAVDIVSFIAGKDIITGDDINRWILAAAIITPELIDQALKQGAKNADEVVDIIKGTGNLAEILAGTGKYADVGGHHPLAKISFKNSSKYDFNEAFSVSPAKLDEVSGITNVHPTITGQQNSLYTQWVKNNPNTKLTLSEMAKIEKQAMINAGIPEKFANGWVDQAFKQLNDLGITDADITNIPWNGVNP